MRTFVIVILGVLPVLCFSGCTRLQAVRVVDAQSGRPLEGVHVERLQSSVRPSPMPLVLYDALSPVERQVTDASGATAFKEPGTKVMCNPSMKNPAYGRAYVKSGLSGVTICYPDEYREITVKPVDGVVEVPLSARRIGGRGAKEFGSDSTDDAFVEQFPEIRGREVMARRR